MKTKCKMDPGVDPGPRNKYYKRHYWDNCRNTNRTKDQKTVLYYAKFPNVLRKYTLKCLEWGVREKDRMIKQVKQMVTLIWQNWLIAIKEFFVIVL